MQHINTTDANIPQHSESASTSGPPCRLLELPAELRTRIYEFALFPAHSQPITEAELSRQIYPPEHFHVPFGSALVRSTGYYDCYIWKRDRSDPNLQRPSLLALNKQIRCEASEIFYSKTIFRVPLALDLSGSFGVRMAQRWLAPLQAVDRDIIKAIKLELHWASQAVYVSRMKAADMMDTSDEVEENDDIHMFADDEELISRLELPVEDEDGEGGWIFWQAWEFALLDEDRASIEWVEI